MKISPCNKFQSTSISTAIRILNGLNTNLGRPQQHINSSITVAVRYNPQSIGDQAGIVAFQNRNYYYFLGIRKKENRDSVFLEKRVNGNSTDVTSEFIDLPYPIYLKIESQGEIYRFFYALKPNEWQQIGGSQDGKILSTKVAGGFVGTMYGMYAFNPID